MDIHGSRLLVGKFIDAVKDVSISIEAKAEIVINLATAWGVDDPLIREALRQALGDEAAEHPYFFWRPAPKWAVGQRVRVVDGAPQVVGHTGAITAVDDAKRYGVRGMSRLQSYSVVLDGGRDPWGFRENQLEEWSIET